MDMKEFNTEVAKLHDMTEQAFGAVGLSNPTYMDALTGIVLAMQKLGYSREESNEIMSEAGAQTASWMLTQKKFNAQ